MYIFNTRTTGGTVFGTTQARYTHATINTDNGTDGVNGMILFPDGVDIALSEVNTAGTVNVNSAWGTTCTSAQWTALATKGCVFLPAAGHRSGTTMYNPGVAGKYWTSSYDIGTAANAQDVTFRSNILNASGACGRKFGGSVRLVCPVE